MFTRIVSDRVAWHGNAFYIPSVCTSEALNEMIQLEVPAINCYSGTRIVVTLKALFQRQSAPLQIIPPP